MKNLQSKILALFILSTFLISGNGLVLSVHTCLATSDKMVSLFSDNSCCSDQTECCPMNQPSGALESKCCSSEFKYEKISAPFLNNKLVELPAADMMFPQIVFLFHEEESTICSMGVEPPDLLFPIHILHQQLLI